MYEIYLTDFSPGAIAESGQCFRMAAVAYGWTVTAQGRYLEIEPGSEPGVFRFSCAPQEFETIWRRYFDLEADYAAYRNKCLKKDKYLRRACAYGQGLRILRQDPWEMLISFVISQRKSIPAIRRAVEELCRAFGEEHRAGRRVYHAFPSPTALACAGSRQLEACGLGYRAKYVHDAACRVAEGRLDLQALAGRPTPEVQQSLMEVYGVGIKVAQCVLLFGYHRLEALPVDVWMDRVIREHYHGKFPRSYQDCAGILQQYLFYYARSGQG